MNEKNDYFTEIVGLAAIAILLAGTLIEPALPKPVIGWMVIFFSALILLHVYLKITKTK